MPTIRQARVGEMIKRDLSEILQKEMRDERVALVTINSVDIARDFSIAKVFISCMGDDRDKALALKALQGASGFLRGQLGAMLELRVVPVLSFRYDTGVDKGVRMFELLKEEDRFFKENPQVDEPASGDPAPGDPAPGETEMPTIPETAPESPAPAPTREAGE